MTMTSTPPRRVVARCPRCRIEFAGGELQIVGIEPGGRLVRRCAGCGLRGPTFWFRTLEVGQ